MRAPLAPPNMRYVQKLYDPAALRGAPTGIIAVAVAVAIGKLALALLASLGLDELLHGVVVGAGDAVPPVHDEDHRHVLVVHGHQPLIGPGI